MQQNRDSLDEILAELRTPNETKDANAICAFRLMDLSDGFNLHRTGIEMGV